MLTRKSIDIVSPHNGRHYTEITKYERDVDRAGKHILTEREYKEMREECRDRMSSQPTPSKEQTNHVHIDFANGRVIKTRKGLDV